MKTRLALVFLLLISFRAQGEPVRALIEGIHTVSLDRPEGVTIPLSYVGSSLIVLEGDTRFFRGIQLELIVPRNFLAHRGSLAAAVYGNLNRIPGTGIVDLECMRVGFDPLPARIQTIYQIPLRPDHGFRNSPYATVLTDTLGTTSFPILFRLMPVIKGISDDVEQMVFSLNVKPIPSDEGALRLNFRYPENLPDKPFTILINDEVISNPWEERLFREGEYHLVLLSDDYRNQSSRFVVERSKILDLTVELQDPTPLLVFEYPENARVYLNNVLLPNPRSPWPVEPGLHELRFQVSDYTIIRPLVVQKGKTYKVALSVDINITENE
jgi:hypothetical protein